MASAETPSAASNLGAAAGAIDAAVLDAVTDQWERIPEIAARMKYWQRPTVRATLWRLMKDGQIAAEQRFMQGAPQQRLIGYYWVFRRKS
jgi:hypothetical protein